MHRSEQPPPGSEISRFVGVYHAEGTLRGELAYWFGKRKGTAHCALCDITHGSVRETTDWRRCRAQLPVAFDTFHLDDQPNEIRHLTHGSTPAVLAQTGGGYVLVLGPEQLEACESEAERLIGALQATVDRLGLVWPSPCTLAG